MKTIFSLACLAMGIGLLPHSAVAEEGPPNWRLIATGNTVPANDGSGFDLDTFAGVSSHLGEFTGEHISCFPTFPVSGMRLTPPPMGTRLW